MDFHIKPYEGLGNIALGMTKETIQHMFGEKTKDFKRGNESVPSDFIKEFLLFVYYSDNGYCNAIELCEPTNTYFKGKNVIGVPYNWVKSFVEQHDANLECNEYGFTSLKFGFGVYVHDLDEGDEPVNSVIVFEKGYYNWLNLN